MQLNYQQIGDQAKPSVFVMHGLFGSLENVNVVAKALAEHFNVINVDLRNHGRSFHDEQMSYPIMANDVKSLMDELKLDKIHLVGHSMGGKVAMQFAQLFPESINKLVVLDIAPVDYHSRHDAIIAALNEVQKSDVSSRSEADTIMSQYIETLGVRQFLLKSLAKNEEGKLAWRFNLDVITEKYDTITSNINETHSCLCDTLFIKGNNSDYILPEHREAIARFFPNARAKIIQGAGHWLHAEKPEAVNRSIIDFLQ
ncbi:alpha/beta hydrolase [Pseudoalteromonas sp. GCY]|uniref:alpha/beta fold hydrolase n=1 Tax=Pseudoalteromonas sp. GCY TaxID=2003316 RepID=UPI000BFEE494|nr:alpha/beta fold hydrolase [Pseudoalteromonas sp. GCY]PHI38263.1 alpha/beta hydrolase [Pseudoalteromonas sp. GCY]QQQ65578.1 alpha/beta fold hydrolase [Pseudoalteromonas sp. GCY]